MIPRQVPPVYSPVSARSILGALPALFAGAREARREVESALARTYGARRVLLTGSGTAALVLALRTLAPREGLVALPGYGCIDLVAAAIRAGVRVRLYDVHPETLSPDLDSVRSVLEQGVDAVVVAHYYGYAADVTGVAALAAEFGVQLIEDAAQAAGGLLDGRPLGGFGPLTVLSFGRGKGTTGGGGGALLATTERTAEQLDEVADSLAAPAPGTRAIAGLAAQLVLGAPALYAIPASIPALRLGEMVYREAGVPDGMPAPVISMLRHAIRAAPRDVERRRRHAARLREEARRCGVRPIRPIAGSIPGYLRLPVLGGPQHAPAPGLGVMRGYPLTLADMGELQPLLASGQHPTPGAAELRDRLITLPTHSRVSAGDLDRICRWMHACNSGPVGTLHPSSRGADVRQASLSDTHA